MLFDASFVRCLGKSGGFFSSLNGPVIVMNNLVSSKFYANDTTHASEELAAVV